MSAENWHSRYRLMEPVELMSSRVRRGIRFATATVSHKAAQCICSGPGRQLGYRSAVTATVHGTTPMVTNQAALRWLWRVRAALRAARFTPAFPLVRTAFNAA